MAVIWKQVLQPIDVQEIEVPVGSKMLNAREQHDQICVWYSCDPFAPKEKRTIAIIRTGNPAPTTDGRYLGMASIHGGNLIAHVFERTF